MGAWNTLGQSKPFQIERNYIVDHQFELKHDNDFLLFTDRYYSTGNFITYRWIAPNLKDSVNHRQHEVFISQEIYTPTDLLEKNSRFFDRPYAGFLGLNYGYSIINQKRYFRLEYSMGVTGKISGAEGLQNLFHETAATDSKIAEWVDQIKNGFTSNLYFTWLREWKLGDNPFSFHLSTGPTIAFGVKDIFLQNEMRFFFGRTVPMYQSLAYDQIGTLRNEFFIAFILAYRYVIHDTLLEGNLIGDSSKALRDPVPNLYLFKMGAFYRLNRNDFKLLYNYQTEETRGAEPHTFITISIARSF